MSDTPRTDQVHALIREPKDRHHAAWTWADKLERELAEQSTRLHNVEQAHIGGAARHRIVIDMALALLRGEKPEDVHHGEYWEDLHDKIAEQATRIAGLTEALRKHGGHTIDCCKWDRMDNGTLFARSDWTCTCGLHAALNTERKEGGT